MLIFVECVDVYVYADDHQQNISSSQLKRPFAELPRTQSSGRPLLAPLLLTPRNSLLCFGGSDISSENKGNSSLSLSDASRKALVVPVGAEAVQSASELLQITGVQGRSTRKLPRLQYSGPPTENIMRSNSCTALNERPDHKAQEANDRTSEPPASKLTERIQSLSSLDRLSHTSRSKQMTSNTRDPLQSETTPFRWSDRAKYTWKCWYGENVISNATSLQRSHTPISFNNNSIGKPLCREDDGIQLERNGDKVKHNSNEQNIISILPITESPLSKIPLRSKNGSMGTFQKNNEKFENTKNKNLNCFELVEKRRFPDPLTAPPPFVRTRLTQMGILVSHSVYNEVFQSTRFRKKVKKTTCKV